MTESEPSYEHDLAIDPDTLDEDWLAQPGLYMRYAQAHAQAIRERDQVWERLKVRRSQLIKEAKENGASNAVLQEAYYRDHQDHKDLKQGLIDTDYQVNILQGVVVAFAHRKQALENEVKLWLGQYYAGPKEPRELTGGKRIIDMKMAATSRESRKQRTALNEKPSAQTKAPKRRQRRQ